MGKAINQGTQSQMRRHSMLPSGLSDFVVKANLEYNPNELLNLLLVSRNHESPSRRKNTS